MEDSGGTGQTGCCEPTPCRKGKIDTHAVTGENKEETNLLFQPLTRRNHPWLPGYQQCTLLKKVVAHLCPMHGLG